MSEDVIHHFDAGEMGCAEGLPAAFRSQLELVPAGEILEIVARDPSAREDLPALARLLGHEVLSSTLNEDADVVVQVRRVGPTPEGT